MPTRKQLAWGAALALGGLVLGYLGGRGQAPVKVVEKQIVDESAVSKAVAQAKAEWQKNVQDNTIVHTVYKEGKVSEKTVYVDRDIVSSGNKQEVTTVDQHLDLHTVTTKEITNSEWNFRLSLGVETSYDLRVQADYRVGKLPILPVDLIMYGAIVAPNVTFKNPSFLTGAKLELRF